MKIQMVCLANSKTERGRILVGVLLENGIPVMDADGPRWMRLALDPKRQTIPAGLVVDVLPRDMIEFEAVQVHDRADCKGVVVFDPYSLRFLGMMPEDLISSHCSVGSLVVSSKETRRKPFDGLQMLRAEDCSIVVGEELPGAKGVAVSLHFHIDGKLFRFPIEDPWFLDVVQVEPEILQRKPAHHIVLRKCRATAQFPESAAVMAVMM